MNVADYLKLPYHIRMVRDEAEGDPTPVWVVWVDELPGCISQGDTPEEAAAMIYEAMEGWIEAGLDGDRAIPLPRPESTHSGKFQVRVPRSLHASLVDAAEAEGVSLNQFVTAALAGAVAWRRSEAKPGPVARGASAAS